MKTSRVKAATIASLLALGLGAAWAFPPRAAVSGLAARWGEWSAGSAQVPLLVVEQALFVHQVTAQGNLRASESIAIGVPADVPSPLKVAWTCQDASRVAQGDVVVRFEPTEFEQRLLDGNSQRATAEALAARTRTLSELSERERERSRDLSRLELHTTQNFAAKDPEIFSRHQIIEAAIDGELSVARLDHATEMEKIESGLSRNKLSQIAVQRRQAEMSIARAEKGLASLELRAPRDGIAILHRDWQGNVLRVGDAVWAGATVARLPNLQKMEAEVFVLEADAGGLSPGKSATVVLEAYPDRTYQGTIARVATLATSPRPEVPTQYYAVVVELAHTDTARMKPGGRVRTTLTLQEQQALTLPRHAVFEQDGEPVVYRQVSNGFEVVPVQLGASSPGRVVIREGIAQGDTLALSKPHRLNTAPSASPRTQSTSSLSSSHRRAP